MIFAAAPAALPACSPGGAIIDAGLVVDAAQRRDARAVIPRDAACPVDAASVGCRYGGGCDLLARNCGTGQACVPGHTASECAPAGPNPLGAPCVRPTDCAPGLLCFGGSVDSQFSRRLACEASDCTPPDWIYRELGGAPGSMLPNGVALCFPEWPCSPVAADCAPDETCEIVDSGDTQCRPAGTGALGMPCEATGCIPGLLRIRASDEGAFCRRACDTEGLPCSGGTCVPYPGSRYGACL